MRILIVEDDPKINSFLKGALESEYFVVDSAVDGEEGISFARTNVYDVIILDSMLPKWGGIDVCLVLREEGNTTPIIGLSVRSETVNKVQFLNAGADDYLTKPFSFEELIARVRALLRRPQVLQTEVLEIEDVALNARRHVVTKNGAEVYLTRKEFLLLEYLMQNKGTVLTRGMILEHVWDMNADPFSNTIETHIMSLRKKIDPKGQSRLIQTVSGVGYKIDYA